LKIAQFRFTAIDFESAGAARGQTDVPVQVGLACWTPGAEVEEGFVSFLYTEREVSWAAQKVHGISRADLAHAPTLVSLWPELKGRLAGNIVVAHGKGTERRFMGAFPGHGFGPWIDTLLLCRAVWPELPDHSLGALCDALGVTGQVDALVPGRRWHDALYDASASLVLLRYMVETLKLAERPIDLLLHPDTSAWHSLRQ